MKMKKKSYIFVANWKMFFQFYDAIAFCSIHHAALSDIAENHTVILCPSFVALSSAKHMFAGAKIFFGAQDCSAFSGGAHTGQISTKALAEVGCAYSIVGHSETRSAYAETDQDVAQKIDQLFQNNCIPILCMGETKQKEPIETIQTLFTKQLSQIKVPSKSTLFIAYEPAWAIQKGESQTEIPTISHIQSVILLLNKIAKELLPHATIKLLYGGGIDTENIASLSRIALLDGFLIGTASTDFQKFQKIVELVEQ